MRPLQLEITGLRSFRAKQTIDFADLTLFAVIGDTGAGKSSILEAIVFALYNASTWDARGGGALMSLDADAMTVVLTFAVGAARYRVNRTVFRNARPAVHALRSPDDPALRFDGDVAVSAEIRRLVGLDYDTFRKTVVLPQGRFAELLNARETERTRVIGELLGLDAVDRLRDKLGPVLQEMQAGLRDRQAARREVGEDPAAEVVVREGEERAARIARDAMTQARTKLAGLLDEQRVVAERDTALTVVARESAAMAERAATIRTLAPAHERLRSERAELEAQRTQTRAALAGADEELRMLAADGRDAASIARVTGEVERLQSDAATLAAQGVQLTEREAALRAEATSIEAAASENEALLAKARAAGDAVRGAEIAHETARGAIERARAAWRAWGTSRDDVARARIELDGLGAEAEDLEAARLACLESIAATDAAYEAARATYADLERANRGAALADGVRSGENCPVCTRPLPADFAAPAAPDLAAARHALTTAEAERNTGRREHDRVCAKLDALHATQQQRTTFLATAQNAYEAVAAVLESLSLDAEDSGEDDALAAYRAALEQAQHGLLAARATRDAEKTASDRADAAHATSVRAHAAAMKLHAAAVREQAASLTRLSTRRTVLPTEFQPTESADDYDFVRIFNALEAARETAEAAAEQQRALAARAADEEGRLRRAETAYRQTVRDPAADGRYAIERSLAAQVSALTACAIAAPPVRLTDDFDDLAAWCAALEAWCGDTRALIASGLAQTAGNVALVTGRIDAVYREHGVDSVGAFDQLLIETNNATAVAGDRVATARRAAERAAELDAAIGELAPVAMALDQLNRHLQNRAFKDFVMRRRERRLLGIGTTILRSMTGGRYAFAEGFEILDGHTGRVRSTKTLSGGETFLASLALALALVEVASRTGGKLDALFLDEGFGNLDAGALDEALAKLAERARSGKLIGIITHVRGIAEQIDTVLKVERRASGSVVELLDGTALTAFMADEVLAGLLGHTAIAD